MDSHDLRPRAVHACLALKSAQEPEFEPLIQCLLTMKGDWQMAGAYHMGAGTSHKPALTPPTTGEYAHLLERAQRKLQAFTTASENLTPDSHLSEAVSVLLDMRHTAYSAVRANGTETPDDFGVPNVSGNGGLGGIGGGLSGAATPWAVQAVFGFGDLDSFLDFGATGQQQGLSSAVYGTGQGGIHQGFS